MGDETTLADVVSAIEGLSEEVESLVSTIAEMQGRYAGSQGREYVFLRTYDESRGE